MILFTSQYLGKAGGRGPILFAKVIIFSFIHPHRPNIYTLSFLGKFPNIPKEVEARSVATEGGGEDVVHDQFCIFFKTRAQNLGIEIA
jgi:hypothetical protein